MPTQQAAPQSAPVYQTEDVILRALANGESFRSVDGAYFVDFYSDYFVVSRASQTGVLNATVFDEEEFSIGFSDTVWEPFQKPVK